jgi:transcriptional regulator with GAF, ATPase, and Fis domain
LDRHEPPLTRRFVVYYCSAVYTGGSTLEEVERNYVLRVFRETGGIVSAAATRLGVPRTTLNAMMKRLGISRSDF